MADLFELTTPAAEVGEDLEATSSAAPFVTAKDRSWWLRVRARLDGILILT